MNGPDYKGRALDCTPCNSGRGRACSCLTDCGADRCTGESVPSIDVPTRKHTRKEGTA